MRIPTGREPGNSGYYGGVGSKPAPRAWRPGRAAEALVPARVRRTAKRLQLKRKRRARDRKVGGGVPMAVLAVLGVIGAFIVFDLVLLWIRKLAG